MKTHPLTSDDRALIRALQVEIGCEALPNSPDLNTVFYLESTPTALVIVAFETLSTLSYSRVLL